MFSSVCLHHNGYSSHTTECPHSVPLPGRRWQQVAVIPHLVPGNSHLSHLITKSASLLYLATFIVEIKLLSLFLSRLSVLYIHLISFCAIIPSSCALSCWLVLLWNLISSANCFLSLTNSSFTLFSIIILTTLSSSTCLRSSKHSDFSLETALRKSRLKFSIRNESEIVLGIRLMKSISNCYSVQGAETILLLTNISHSQDGNSVFLEEFFYWSEQ